MNESQLSIMMLFVVALLCYVTRQLTIIQFNNQAVEHGAGVWVESPTGKKTFQWKQP